MAKTVLHQHSCDACHEVDTHLMYQYTENGEMHDRHVCTDCLIDDIRKAFLGYVGRKINYFGRMTDTHLRAISLLDILELNEAMSINLEFADVKIQRIEPFCTLQIEVSPSATAMVVIVRSTLNNQYHAYPFYANNLAHMLDIVTDVFKKEFEGNTYGKDMIPF
jgi:hypothetical protein